jgi:hypothetical protein
MILKTKVLPINKLGKINNNILNIKKMREYYKNSHKKDPTLVNKS